MTQPDFSKLADREIFLNPGELACGLGECVFGTLLGSCVAITLWHPVRQFGCMCHFVLPSGATRLADRGRYGDTAFALMKTQFGRQGIPLNECVAKIFGGGSMFTNEAALPDIGKRNIAIAHTLLHDAGLTVAAEHVGGNGYRRLYFDVATGDVWLKFDWVESDQQDVIL